MEPIFSRALLLVVVGNSLVVTAVFTHAKLRRSMTNRFIVSLAIADLMVGLLVLPFSSANEVSCNIILKIKYLHSLTSSAVLVSYNSIKITFRSSFYRYSARTT